MGGWVRYADGTLRDCAERSAGSDRIFPKTSIPLVLEVVLLFSWREYG